jgi:hypothetical protein
MKSTLKDIFKISSVPIIGASLCCLSPLLLFVFGLSSLSFAASLSDVFYGEWKWAFRGFGIVLLFLFLFFHFWRKGICSLDTAKREKNKIINTVLLSLFVFVLGYLFFLYVVVHYAGVWAGIWQ